MTQKKDCPGVLLTDEILQKIRVAASMVHHGAITIHIDAQRSTVDVEITSRERVSL